MNQHLDTSINVQRAIAGDHQAIDFLIRKFSPWLLAHAVELIGARRGFEAEDLVQQVWAVTLPKLSNLKPRDQRHTPVFLAFLSTVQRRTFNDLLRRSIRNQLSKSSNSESPDPIDLLSDQAASTIDELVRHERSQAVCAALAELTSEERDILIMRGFEGIRYDRIAEVLKISAASAEARFRRAKIRLRDLLEAEWVDEMLG